MIVRAAILGLITLGYITGSWAICLWAVVGVLLLKALHRALEAREGRANLRVLAWHANGEMEGDAAMSVLLERDEQ